MGVKLSEKCKVKSEKSIYILTNEKYEGAENYPVIKINFLSSFIDFKNIDYLIFTSKNGVRAIDKITSKWKKFPSFAIGKATAKEIEKLGGKVEFIAKNAYGDEFAKEIVENYKHKTFLFLRAEKIISPVGEIFKDSTNNLKEAIVYQTVCNSPKKSLKKPSVVIFTSPSTVECFAKINDFKNIKSIAIGKKTKKALLKYTDEILTPSYPGIKNCINLAESLT